MLESDRKKEIKNNNNIIAHNVHRIVVHRLKIGWQICNVDNYIKLIGASSAQSTIIELRTAGEKLRARIAQKTIV